MGLSNSYTIKKKSLKELLDNLDAFEDKMKRFLSNHPDYMYSIDINNNDEEWIVEINIKTKDEQNNITPFTGIVGSHSVL